MCENHTNYWHRRRLLLAGFGAAAAAAGSAALGPRFASANDAWPARLITMVVPFPPGGQAELAAVPVAAEIGRQLGVDVEVSYVTGGGGAVGNAAVANAKPDGATLLMTLTSVFMLPEGLRRSGGQVPYEMPQLSPIARILSDPLILAVRADAPWRTIDEFLDDARSHPGTIVFGSSGLFGTLHVAMGMLARAANLTMKHKAFQGAGPALKALLSGDVQAVPASPGLLKQHVAAGRLRVLASWGFQRKEPFIDIPTLHQLGYGRLEFTTWAGLFAPAGLPEPLASLLRSAVGQAAVQPALAALFKRAGSPMAYQDAPDFETFIAAEQRRLLPVVRGLAEGEPLELSKATVATSGNP